MRVTKTTFAPKPGLYWIVNPIERDGKEIVGTVYNRGYKANLQKLKRRVIGKPGSDIDRGQAEPCKRPFDLAWLSYATAGAGQCTEHGLQGILVSHEKVIGDVNS